MILLALALPVSAGATSEALAEVDGVAITLRRSRRRSARRSRGSRSQIYTRKRQKVEALIAERLLAREAQKRGTTIQALLDAEVTSEPPTLTGPST